MSLGGILSTSLSGLFTSQEALRVTGTNIANVNTPGYARERVNVAADVQNDRTIGVKVETIERVVNRFLEGAILEARSDSARAEAINSLHDRLQASLGPPDSESNLAGRMNTVFAALADLTLAPADGVARQQFLSDFESYANELSRVADTVQDLRNSASIEIESRIGGINDAIRQIHDLNEKINQQTTTGGQTGGLENERQAALEFLASNIDIRVTENSDGTVNVSTLSGTQLVTRAGFFNLAYSSPGGVSAATEFPPITLQLVDLQSDQLKGPQRPIDGDIRGGALRGLLDMRDKDLVDLSVSLGELAARVGDEMNAAHNLNSAVPAPNSLTGSTTAFAATDPHNFTGTTSFSILDANNRVVATTTYDFDANPADSFADMVTAVNAGLGGAGTLSFVDGKMSISATNAANGVAISEDPANSSDRAGRSFSHFFGMNDLVTGRSSGLFETGVKATDAHGFGAGETVEFVVRDALGKELRTVTLDTTGNPTYGDLVTALDADLSGLFSVSLDANGKLITTSTGPQKGMVLTVKNDTTNANGSGIGFGQLFGVGARYRAEAAVDFGLDQDLGSNAQTLATARVDLSGGIGSVALSVGDQSGALALQDRGSAVISMSAAGGLSAQRRTLAGLNGAVLGSFGDLANRASAAADDTRSLEVELDQRKQGVSGVNIDEELANLVIYQNSYNAAARILSSVQELYDTLLNAV
ncbi:flagellar hook-associated protein FlgK [Iodidimonas gelatinilytica]|nr:flagellar hook-associated protein FlgK [Iodidimonas gelatinilytica]